MLDLLGACVIFSYLGRFWSSYTTLTNIDGMRQYMDVSKLEIPPELVRYDRDNWA
jgi:hypothetical protein